MFAKRLEGGEDLREGGEEWHSFRLLWLSVYILIIIVNTLNFCVLKFLINPERKSLVRSNAHVDVIGTFPKRECQRRGVDTEIS
jgi:hypothetical protein